MLSLPNSVSIINIKTHVWQVFSNRFPCLDNLYIFYWLIDFSSIDSTFSTSLKATFSEKWNILTIMEVEGDKSPRHDRFPFKFAQSFWELFKDKLVRLFHTFYMTAKFDHKKSFISRILRSKVFVLIMI